MAEITTPAILDQSFADALVARKGGFVDDAELPTVQQHSAALVPTTDFPGWIPGLTASETIIETYVASEGGVTATSDNQPYVNAWHPLVSWLDQRVRSTLADFGLVLDGDAYATASLTAANDLGGAAHMDDDMFVPNDSVKLVAIIGQWQGPRVATAPVEHLPLRPLGQVVFSEAALRLFEAGEFDHCACPSDEIVLFPQFGQLHAGPASSHVTKIAGTNSFRQLLVYRATATRAET